MVLLIPVIDDRTAVVTVEYWCHFLGNNADICQYSSYFVTAAWCEVDGRQYVEEKFRKLLFGLFSLVFGLLILLDRYEVMVFDYENWWKLWPIFIIAIAINRVILKKPIKVSISNEYPYDKESDFESGGRTYAAAEKNKMNRGFIVGDIRFSEPNWPLENMKLYNAIGDYYFDFSKAYIPEGESTIDIKGWIGDVKMIIPENVPVEIDLRVQVGM